MNGMINDKPKETRRLQQSAVEITRLSPEYSRRSKTETQRFRALLESNSEIRKAIKKKESTIQLIPFFLLLNYSKNKYFL